MVEEPEDVGAHARDERENGWNTTKAIRQTEANATGKTVLCDRLCFLFLGRTSVALPLLLGAVYILCALVDFCCLAWGFGNGNGVHLHSSGVVDGSEGAQRHKAMGEELVRIARTSGVLVHDRRKVR